MLRRTAVENVVKIELVEVAFPSTAFSHYNYYLKTGFTASAEQRKRYFFVKVWPQQQNSLVLLTARLPVSHCQTGTKNSQRTATHVH